jgi:hypothetical protein
MNTIERLKQLLIDENLKVHDISVMLNAHIGTITRWLKTGRISEAWRRDLDDLLVSKGK